MNLGQRAVRGVAWAYGVFFAGRLFTLVTTAVLARLLLPDEFGLLGYALILLSLIDATQDFGINDALIYNTEREDDTANTAFWMNVGVGVGQYALIWLLAPLALQLPASGTSNPIIVDVLRVFGLVFLINALGSTHDGLMQKHLAFRDRYLPEFFSAVIKGVASIVLALILQNVWALVWGHIIGALVRAAAKWSLMPFRPQFAFSTKRARFLWGFGASLVVINVMTVVLDQADQAATSLFIGVTQLGFFTIAVKIPEMVIANFSLVLTRVLFPVFTKLKDDTAQLTDAFLMTTQFTALVTIPAGLGIAAVAPELVLSVFGGQWVPAVGLVQALALLSMATTLPWSAGDALKAVGRPDITARLMFAEMLYTLPLVFAVGYITREAYWTSMSNVVAVLITAGLRLWVTSRYFGYGVGRYWRVFRTPLIAGTVMVGAVQLVRWVASDLPMIVATSNPRLRLVLNPIFPYPATLIACVLVGIAVYVPLVWFLEQDTLLRAREFVRGALRPRPPEPGTTAAD